MSTAAGPWVRVDAPAKVNLRLLVLGPRPDGYHEVDTVMLAVDLLDEVLVRVAPGGEVRLEASGGEELPEPERNLALRGALGVLERARARGLVDGTTGLDVRLTKRIPVEAGLGGGSADAAAAALAARTALASLASSGGELPDAELRAALAEIGTDCAFFLDARATGLARCTGRGEVVAPIEAPTPWWLLLVVPDVRSPTGAVYAALQGTPAGPGAAPGDPSADPLSWLGDPPEALRARLANDLEPAALCVRPELARWREVFAAGDAEHLLLSGSGSAFFGLYGREEAARRAGRTIERLAQAAGLAPRAVRVVRPTGAGLLPRPSN